MPLSEPAQALPEYLPIGAVAAMFSVSLDTLRRWDKQGRLTALRTPTGQRRYRREDVESLLVERQSVAS